MASFNWVSGDPKTHAVAYVCVSLLLEHLVIPMILSRPGVNADDVQTQRLKWILVKQVIPSTIPAPQRLKILVERRGCLLLGVSWTRWDQNATH